MLAALIAIVVYRALDSETESITRNELDETVAEALESITPSPAISAVVYEAILPSLVVIQTSRDVREQEKGFGIGSGVIINSDAAILTSLHVVEDASEIRIGFADGTQTSAVIAEKQPESDIALLLPISLPEVFAPAVIGSSRGLRIGDEVFAVGNPLGLAGSLSAGVISGLDRAFSPANTDLNLEGVIQFDAAVNPGNSGGPLLDRCGRVVGIVTGLINPAEQEFFTGIGFAVPIDVALEGAGGPAQ